MEERRWYILWDKNTKRNLVHTYTNTHSHTNTQTHAHQCVVALWPPARQGTASMCEQCELPVRELCCDIRLEQGQPIYGWWHVRLSDGGPVIGREKTEESYSYGGFGICSTVTCPSSRWVCEPVERYCSGTRNSTCSTMGPSTRACKC